MGARARTNRYWAGGSGIALLLQGSVFFASAAEVRPAEFHPAESGPAALHLAAMASKALGPAELPPAAMRPDELRLADCVRLGLLQNPDVRLQSGALAVTQAQQQQARGEFDWVMSAELNRARSVTPPFASATTQTRLDSAGYQFGVSRLWRNGWTLDGKYDLASTQESGAAPQSLGKLDLVLTVPLLRGKGEATSVGETVAHLNVQRSQYELRGQVSQAVYRIMLAYWDYRASSALVLVAQNSETRSRDLLLSNQKLVAADEKPRGDLVLLQGDLADKGQAVQVARLNLNESRKALGRLLGLDLAAMNALAEPVDGFPAVSDPVLQLPAHGAALNATALARRAEFQALALQQEALRQQFSGAANRMKPQLDLKVGVGYGKAWDGGARYPLPTASGRLQNEPSLTASLSYRFPVENNLASGVAQEYAAQLLQLEVRQQDLRHSVLAGVDSAMQALLANAEQLRLAQQGLARYEQAVQQEIVKQRNGVATLIDVVNVESRFINARVNLLQLQQAYAKALARLRYETGTFLIAANGGQDGNAGTAANAEKTEMAVKDANAAMHIRDGHGANPADRGGTTWLSVDELVGLGSLSGLLRDSK